MTQQNQGAGVRAALFDLDGVICDTDRLAQREIRTVLESMGYSVTEALLQALMGLDTAKTHAWLQCNLDPDFNTEAFSAAVASGLTSVRIDHEFAVPGALALLNRFASLCPIYVTTNNELGIARHYLASMQIDHLFTDLYACDTRPNGKTKRHDVALVKHAHRSAGNEIIFVDDRLDNCLAVNGICRPFWAPARAEEIVAAKSDMPPEVVACETLDSVAQHIFGD